jgi:hypothetical protein
MSAEVQSSILSSRAIAERRKEHGFDGVIYPSYFSMVRLGSPRSIPTMGSLSDIMWTDTARLRR